MEHTQGEWESVGIAIKSLKDPTFSHVDILCNDMIRVARSSGVGDDLAIANARLIAAAPDLLAACELALSKFRLIYGKIEDGEYGDDMQELYDDKNVWPLKVLRDAITKVTQ